MQVSKWVMGTNVLSTLIPKWTGLWKGGWIIEDVTCINSDIILWWSVHALFMSHLKSVSILTNHACTIGQSIFVPMFRTFEHDSYIHCWTWAVWIATARCARDVHHVQKAYPENRGMEDPKKLLAGDGCLNEINSKVGELGMLKKKRQIPDWACPVFRSTVLR